MNTENFFGNLKSVKSPFISRAFSFFSITFLKCFGPSFLIFSQIVLNLPILTTIIVKISKNLVVILTTNLIRKIPKHLPNLAIFEPELLKRLNAFEKTKHIPLC